MLGAMRRGEWSSRHHPGVHRLAGQTLGLVGFGTSAQAVAHRAVPFGLKLLAWVRNPAKYHEPAARLGVELVSLDCLLDESDFVSIHLPLTAETRGLVGTAQLARMKPSAMLINTARGAIIDEAALVAALQSGRLASAALDVFDGIDVLVPPENPDQPFPAHHWLLTRHGIYLLENLDLEALAASGASQFAFVFAPLRLKGATGSPGNPLAIR